MSGLIKFVAVIAAGYALYVSSASSSDAPLSYLDDELTVSGELKWAAAHNSLDEISFQMLQYMSKHQESM